MAFPEIDVHTHTAAPVQVWCRLVPLPIYVNTHATAAQDDPGWGSATAAVEAAGTLARLLERTISDLMAEIAHSSASFQVVGILLTTVPVMRGWFDGSGERLPAHVGARRPGAGGGRAIAGESGGGCNGALDAPIGQGSGGVGRHPLGSTLRTDSGGASPGDPPAS